MSELDARYARGQDTRRMFGGGTIRNAGSVPGAWDVAPDLERILGEALFGTIWRRDTLSPVQREMITLSTLIVLAREPQLRQHLGNALHIGLTPEQIVELIIHDTWYGGTSPRLVRWPPFSGAGCPAPTPSSQGPPPSGGPAAGGRRGGHTRWPGVCQGRRAGRREKWL